MIKSRENSIGAWAFLIGIILAVIIGVFTGSYTNPLMIVIIFALGLVVGYFVPEKDVLLKPINSELLQSKTTLCVPILIPFGK